MSINKVLLMQGPLNVNGIDLVLQYLYPDTTKRSHVWVKYNCETNIRYMSMAFRSKGFKICYSGWNEDREWLEANRDLFDFLAISDQTNLRTHNIRGGTYISNNKEKMYFAAQEGLAAITEVCGNNAAVLRIRSDVAVNQELMALQMERIKQGSNIVLIEYLLTDKMLAIPEIMHMGEISILRMIYTDLYTRSRTNTSYHLSSHVEHGISLVKLKQAGVISSIQCMSKACFDSMVLKGGPRYFEYMFPDMHNNYFFDGEMSVPQNYNIDAIIAGFPEFVAGPEPG